VLGSGWPGREGGDERLAHVPDQGPKVADVHVSHAHVLEGPSQRGVAGPERRPRVVGEVAQGAVPAPSILLEKVAGLDHDDDEVLMEVVMEDVDGGVVMEVVLMEVRVQSRVMNLWEMGCATKNGRPQ